MVSEADSEYVCQAVTPIPTTRETRCITIPGRRLLISNQAVIIEKTSTKVSEGWGVIHRALSMDRVGISKTRKSRIMLIQVCRLPNREKIFLHGLAVTGDFLDAFPVLFTVRLYPWYIEIVKNMSGYPAPVIYPFPA
jgi:hypothetical protein